MNRYEVDPCCRELETEVSALGSEAGRRYALLVDTILYPEGGGQPADHGWIGDTRVVDVQLRDGEIRHYVDGPVAKGKARLKLDWERRFDHMQHHTGQHLLSAIAEDRFGWVTTSFHLGARGSDVELSAAGLGEARLQALEEALAEEIRRARPVRPRAVPPEELGSLKLRTRGLPEGHRGSVRLIEIEGLDLNTCGGTHLASTSEIESLHLLGTEPMRGGTRLYFVAGRRARRLLEAHERRNARLRSVLGCGDDELVAAAEARVATAKLAARRERELQAELARSAAEALAARGSRVIDAHFETLDAGVLRELGRALAPRIPGRLALLTAGRDQALGFLVLAGESVEADVAEAGAAIAALFEGRGGGTGRCYQGKAATLVRRAEALERLEALR